jgi:hypothetical protein
MLPSATCAEAATVEMIKTKMNPTVKNDFCISV